MLKFKYGITIDDLKPYGFHSIKQKGFTRWYRCVPVGSKLIMVSVADKTTTSDLSRIITGEILIDHWYSNDPRIHKIPKCRYSDKRDVYEVLYDLIKDGLIEKV